MRCDVVCRYLAAFAVKNDIAVVLGNVLQMPPSACLYFHYPFRARHRHDISFPTSGIGASFPFTGFHSNSSRLTREFSHLSHLMCVDRVEECSPPDSRRSSPTFETINTQPARWLPLKGICQSAPYLTACPSQEIRWVRRAYSISDVQRLGVVMFKSIPNYPAH